MRVPLESVQRSPRNPRRALQHVEELAESIREYGLLQPLVLRPREGRFEVIAGHRRLEAIRALGWDEVPAVLREADDDESYLLTLIENLQREDLSPREEASALEVLLRERGWSTRQVGDAIKRSNAYVSRRLRVFEDPLLAPLVLERRLPVSVAEELLPLPPAQRRFIAEQAAEEAWDRARVRQELSAGKQGRRSARKIPLLRRAREFRRALREVVPSTLSAAESDELRLIFRDLALLGKADADEEREHVLPPLRRVMRA